MSDGGHDRPLAPFAQADDDTGLETPAGFHDDSPGVMYNRAMPDEVQTEVQTPFDSNAIVFVPGSQGVTSGHLDHEPPSTVTTYTQSTPDEDLTQMGWPHSESQMTNAKPRSRNSNCVAKQEFIRDTTSPLDTTSDGDIKPTRVGTKDDDKDDSQLSDDMLPNNLIIQTYQRSHEPEASTKRRRIYRSRLDVMPPIDSQRNDEEEDSEFFEKRAVKSKLRKFRSNRTRSTPAVLPMRRLRQQTDGTSSDRQRRASFSDFASDQSSALDASLARSDDSDTEVVYFRQSKRRQLLDASSESSADPSASIRIVLTGLEKTNTVKKQIKAIEGAVYENDVEKATHLVAPKGTLKRTVKMLCGISCCKHIVDEQWLVDSAEAGKAVDEEAYCLRDASAESKWEFQLSQTMYEHTLEQRQQLFAGHHFFITNHKSILPPVKELKRIVECAGGEAETKGSAKEGDIVITTEAALATVTAQKAVAKVDKNRLYAPELVLRSILQQHINLNAWFLEM